MWRTSRSISGVLLRSPVLLAGAPLDSVRASDSALVADGVLGLACGLASGFDDFTSASGLGVPVGLGDLGLGGIGLGGSGLGVGLLSSLTPASEGGGADGAEVKGTGRDFGAGAGLRSFLGGT